MAHMEDKPTIRIYEYAELETAAEKERVVIREFITTHPYPTYKYICDILIRERKIEWISE